MNIKMSLLNRAVRTGILTLGIFSATQAQAIVPPNMDYPVIDEIPIIDEVFHQADADGNGQLSVNEFYQLHSAASLIEFEMTFKAMDADQSREVTYREFAHFLPGKDADVAEKQFFYAAGKDGLLDLKEFIMMRIKEQGANTDLLWKFALLDINHDGQLAPREFYLHHPLPAIDPPFIDPEKPIDPEGPKEPEEPKDPIKPVEPEEPKDPIKPVEPEGPKDPIKPVEPEEPKESTELSEKPEEATGNIILPVDDVFVGPVKPTPVSPELIAELEEKIAATKSKILRVEKSISRTQEKWENASSDKKAARLERRLKRQNLRLEELLERYEALVEKLKMAQEAMNS